MQVRSCIRVCSVMYAEAHAIWTSTTKASACYSAFGLLNDLTADKHIHCLYNAISQKSSKEDKIIVTISILEQNYTGRKQAHVRMGEFTVYWSRCGHTVSTHTSCPSIKCTLWQFWPQIRGLHMAHSVPFCGHTLAIYLGTLTVSSTIAIILFYTKVH